METADCADQRPEGDLLKDKSASDRRKEEPTCNGHIKEEDSKKETFKRNLPSPEADENEADGKKSYVKLEDHGRGEIPAHHARRPPNGFLLFCKRHRDIVSAKNPNLENRGVTKLLGNWWRTLEEDEREKYKELARQNKEIFIANNPQFTWYKLPAPPLRTLVTRPSNRRPPKLEPSLISNAGPITPGKLADESQLGGLTSLLSSSLSPPTTPLITSPPSPTAVTAPAPPKKRFLLKSRAKQSAEESQSLSESDELTDWNSKKSFKTAKKKYKKKKSWNSLKYKKNLKMKWNESFSSKMYLEGERNGQDPWKSESGCTQQQLIEKIVDSSFDSAKTFQDFEVQRTLDYINTEHTYQKNPSRFWQQQKQQKSNKKDDYIALQVVTKIEGAERNIISPNLNNNTIVISESRPEVKNGLSYSFNDNNNLIIDYVDPNQRKLDQSSIQTNHDRMRSIELEDGYIPGGKKRNADESREDCDNTKRLEDQNKPLKIAQDEIEENAMGNREEEEEEEEEEENDDEGDDDEEEEEEDEEEEESEENEEEVDSRGEIPKNCDRDDASFQSILGKVSREIVSMMKEREPESAEDMAVARFNVREKSETDSDGSWYDKSDGSPPESPGGRRSKRSCKGQRYEQFIKDSVSRKRNKTSDAYSAIADGNKKNGESKGKRRKLEQTEESDTSKDVKGIVEPAPEALLSKEKEMISELKDNQETNSQAPEDLTLRQGTKASDIIQLKLDLESKLRRENEERPGRRHREIKKSNFKKKPVSKVQMIKEKRELHIGEFNLNEKIEELPLLSFESFLQKKRQRKKRLLGLKKDSMKNKFVKNKLEKFRPRSPNGTDSAPVVPNKATNIPGHTVSKPDFADLTTLAETALTLLSLREPRKHSQGGDSACCSAIM